MPQYFICNKLIILIQNNVKGLSVAIGVTLLELLGLITNVFIFVSSMSNINVFLLRCRVLQRLLWVDCYCFRSICGYWLDFARAFGSHVRCVHVCTKCYPCLNCCPCHSLCWSCLLRLGCLGLWPLLVDLCTLQRSASHHGNIFDANVISHKKNSLMRCIL